MTGACARTFSGHDDEVTCVGVTPDGGASFVLAFQPRGAALVVLGSLERWLWANDGRLRAFYCQPRKRDASERCSAPADGPADERAADCFALAAVAPCVQTMLRRALDHARIAWPEL